LPRRVPETASTYELSFEDLTKSAPGPIDWSLVFGVARPVRVEIGVGTSTFLVEVAQKTPEFSYVGFEYSGKRVLKFLRKVESAGVANIRMLRLDAARVLDRLFAEGSIDHFYINHPDPWPKRRHEKKRFVSPSNASRLRQLLRAGGGISLRTDFAAYAQQMLDVLDAEPGMVNLAGRGSFALAPRETTQTHYESKFLKSGRQIYYLEYSKQVADENLTSPEER
jgi:tRNA (guanine-N7-)-methyltransferase